MDRPRIAHFVSEFEVGGIFSFVKALAHVQVQSGYKVYTCSLGKNKKPEPTNGDGVCYIEFGIQNHNPISMLNAVVKFLRNEQIAVLHAHPGTLSRLAGVLAGVPVIISTLHGSWSHVNVLTWIFHKWLANRTSALVANSSFTRGYFTSLFGLSEVQLYTIYNGVDLEYFDNVMPSTRSEILCELNLPLDARIVVYAGRLHADKGLNVLLDATWIARRQVPNLHVLIIGSGNIRAALDLQVVQGKLENTVHFVAARSDIRSILGIADICVLPSTGREGFGLAIVEAMALGIPVIGTNLGGIPEIITNGVNGCLVPPGDDQSLASAITNILNSPERARELAERARQTVVERFNLVRMAKEYRELYEIAMHESNLKMQHERS